MKTEELIGMLATGDPRPTNAPPRRVLVIAWGAGLALAAVAMWGLLGLNPHLRADLAASGFWLKLGFATLLVAASLPWVIRLGQPGRTEGVAPRIVMACFAAVWLLGAVAFLSAAPDARMTLLFGQTWRICPWLIASLSLPVLVGGFIAMRRLAPTRPRRTGAAIGLLSGATGMLAYLWHCPELATPFIAIWYALGALIPTALGAWLGPRVLRW
jgi:hypothetical protein